jgi:hypothetical protein
MRGFLFLSLSFGEGWGEVKKIKCENKNDIRSLQQEH